jgi:hypothetical protein
MITMGQYAKSGVLWLSAYEKFLRRSRGSFYKKSPLVAEGIVVSGWAGLMFFELTDITAHPVPGFCFFFKRY